MVKQNVDRRWNIGNYYMNGVFPQRSLVDSWSRGVQYVVTLHSVQYVVILTQLSQHHYILLGRNLASMVKLIRAYVHKII